MEEYITQTKQKISFDITIGSHFPEKEYSSQITLPQGGAQYIIQIEYDYLPDKGDNFDQAVEALKKHVQKNFGEVEFHIWYWTWLNP